VPLFVVKCGDEREAQPESFSAVSVSVTDDFEPLEAGDKVFNTPPLLGDGAVLALAFPG
jgi:hypothetical protein